MIYAHKHRLIIYPPETILPLDIRVEYRKGHACVEARYNNILILAAAGLDVPSPFDVWEYDWPCRPGEEPHPTQKIMSKHMIIHPRSYVFSDMRTGKSRSALWAADQIMRRARTRVRCLIVSDIEALSKSWEPEIFANFMGLRSCAILYGTEAQRRKELERDVDFYLINHDGLKIGFGKHGKEHTSLAAAIFRRDDIKLAVFDEAASYRNKQTEQWRAAYNLVSKRVHYAWALTGTPTPNGPVDAYGIKKLIDLNYKEPFQDWQERCTIRKGPFRRVPAPGSEAIVDALLSPAVRISRGQRFVESEVQVPPPLLVALTDRQKEFMKLLKQELLITMDGGEDIPAVNEASLRTKFIQLACGAIYDSEHNTHHIEAGPRLDTLTTLIERIPGKIIVCSPLTSVVAMLDKKLASFGCVSILGQDKHGPRRTAAITRFINGPDKVLNTHPQPISRGLDLTCASTIIHYAPIDRTETYLQVAQRINGPAQKQVRRIIRLAGCGIEIDMYNKLERNESLQGVILKLKEMRI